MQERSKTILQASQSIASMEAICREVVENSLDAGSKRIDVIVHLDGDGKICIQDDGEGFPPGQLGNLHSRYHTSKTYQENSNMQESFGFRGVALSSIIGLAGRVKICSRHGRAEYELGKLICANHDCIHDFTRITIEDPFSAVPVRKNIALGGGNLVKIANDTRLELERLYVFARAFCQFRLFFYFGGKERIVIYPALSDHVGKLLHLFSGMTFRHADVQFAFDDDLGQSVHGSLYVIYGHCKRRYTALNGRPVDWSKLVLLLSKIENNGCDSITLVDVRSSLLEYDLNVEPDKRTPLIVHERRLLAALERSLLPSLQAESPSAKPDAFISSSARTTYNESIAYLSSPHMSSSSGRNISSSKVDAHSSPIAVTKRARISSNGDPFNSCSLSGCSELPLDTKENGRDIARPVDHEVSQRQSRDYPSESLNAADFDECHIIGNFNKSFILVKLKRSAQIFAIDQHAADERVQLETLSASFTPDSHTLLEPLSSSIEPLAYEWITPQVTQDIKRVFGFDFELSLDERLLTIRKCPLLGGSMLGCRDLLNILDKSQLTGQVLLSNCPAIMSYLAMRACKSAIKLGDSLDRPRMAQLVTHLMRCNGPWVLQKCRLIGL